VNIGSPEQEHESAPPPSIGAAAVTTRVSWRVALPRCIGAALIGTALLAFFGLFQSLLPAPLTLLLIVPFTGAIAVWLYSARDSSIETGKGFRVGSVTGLLVSLIQIISGVLALAIDKQALLGKFREPLKAVAAGAADPAAKDLASKLLGNDNALLAFLALGMVILCFVFILCAGVGGAIAGRARHS
jgi:hypothetical protein